jgi:zinc-binding alcohol dehydrogenase family protein
MKAVAVYKNLPVHHPECLLDVVDASEPELRPHDLLVEVRAVSVNPVDVKLRASGEIPAGAQRILGWDAAGVVLRVGPDAQGFGVGDEVYYAGAVDRPGSNAERQAVDARIVAKKPRTLGFADAAALPLTAITAWELLFDRLRVARGGGQGSKLLVVGAAGGVGSMLVQLARRYTALEVFATASRAESAAWVRELGAHHVIDHRRPLGDGLRECGAADGVDIVAGLAGVERHYPQLVEVLRPQGQLGVIEQMMVPLDARAMMPKSLSLHWEMMFTRSLFGTADLAAQGRLLEAVAQGIDGGELRGTRRRHFGALSAATLREAHAWIESGQAIGKAVLDGIAAEVRRVR